MKRRTCGLAVMTVLALWAGALSAQIEIRDPVAVGRDTPRGTLKVLAQAMEQGDADALSGILLATNETEARMVEAMARTAVSAKRMRDAAVAQFGEGPAEALVESVSGGGEAAMRRMDAANESIDGQTAVVRFQDVQEDPVTLVLVGETWHVPVASLARNLDERGLERRIAEVEAFNVVMAEVAEQIAAEAYDSPREARQALYEGMVRAAEQVEGQADARTDSEAGPATQPTTQQTQVPAGTGD